MVDDIRDLLTRCEKRGYWTAPEGALYISQVMGIKRDQSVVNNSWRTRQGEKPPLDAFAVKAMQPYLQIGITIDSFREWSEHYTTRTLRTDKEEARPPAGCLTVAEVAERLDITRREAYLLVYEAQELKSQVFDKIEMTRDWSYPLRCVTFGDLEEYRRNHR